MLYKGWENTDKSFSFTFVANSCCVYTMSQRLLNKGLMDTVVNKQGSFFHRSYILEHRLYEGKNFACFIHNVFLALELVPGTC